MNILFSHFDLGKLRIRNRIVFPPVVCFGYPDDSGMVTDRNVKHYEDRSRDGAGIVITEATSIRPEGRAAPGQLGVWSDLHISGLGRITSTVQANGALSLLQLHHAGIVSPETVAPVAAGASGDEKNPRTRAMTLDEVKGVRDAYLESAVRARKAGFQGVELHGAHGYLLNQFASSFFNRRTDEYGGDFEGRMKLATELIHGIRQLCGSDFLIGYRMGVNSPLLEDGIRIAKYLESLGIDILHASHGGSLLNLPRVPVGFDYNWICYSGTVIKKELKIPVIVVNEIKTADRAAYLVENGHADFVALGRPILADPQWVKHVRNGEKINECFHCKPKCKWYQNSDLCPAGLVLKRSE